MSCLAANRLDARAEVFLPRSGFQKGKHWGRSCNGCSMDWARVREIAVYMLFQPGEFAGARQADGSTHPMQIHGI